LRTIKLFQFCALTLAATYLAIVLAFEIFTCYIQYNFGIRINLDRNILALKRDKNSPQKIDPTIHNYKEKLLVTMKNKVEGKHCYSAIHKRELYKVVEIFSARINRSTD
jgi:hypothetical protein